MRFSKKSHPLHIQVIKLVYVIRRVRGGKRGKRMQRIHGVVMLLSADCLTNQRYSNKSSYQVLQTLHLIMTLRRIRTFFGRQQSSASLSDAEISVLANNEHDKRRTCKQKLQPTLGTSSSTKPKQHSVRFSTVQERRYNRILGDNPCCDWPLSLGWNWVQTELIPIQEYETTNHEANPAYKNAKYYEHETAERRRLLIRHSSGLSESQLRLEERQRRMQLTLEVFSSSSLRISESACSVLPSNAETLLTRYGCEQRSRKWK